MTKAASTITTFWKTAEARDWEAFSGLLADDVVYELPQTRERIRGKEAYVRFNREYPGDWHVRVQRLVADDRHAATLTEFTVDGEQQPAQTFFDLDDHGLINRITDFWPVPYEPPPGREHLVERY